MATIHPTDVASQPDRRGDRPARAGIIGWQRSAWSSVLMAAVTAIAAQLVFTALGLAIGATAIDASEGRTGDAGDVGVAAGAWWLITGTISLVLGGLTLGRMSGIPRSADLLLAALALWAVTAVFGFFVVWSGMMSAATSPLASMSVPAIDQAATARQDPGMRDAQLGAGTTASDQGSVGSGTQAQAERAQNAARTASWWTVIGMLIGAGATMGGAWATAPRATVLVGD